MRVVIVDADKESVKNLVNILNTFEAVKIIGIFDHPLDAMNNIKDLYVDLVFMEIEVNNFNVLEVVPWFYNVDEELSIVFTTNNTEHALSAYDMGIIDYLVKPLTHNRMKQTLDIINKRHKPKRDYGVSITSFGTFDLKTTDGEVVRWRTRKSKELLAFLWMNQDSVVGRDIVLETMFPSEALSKSSALLSTTIYQMRQTLGKFFGEDFLAYLNNGYQLKVKIESDYEDLLKILKTEEYSVVNFEKVELLYKGDFLGDEAYEWSIKHSERVRDIVKDYLLKSMDALDKEISFYSLERIMLFTYDLDRLDELMVVKILENYARHKQMAKTDKFYQDYVINLDELISSAPSALVKEKYQELKKLNIK